MLPPPMPPPPEPEARSPVIFLFFTCFIFPLMALAYFFLWKFNRQPPQSTRFVISLLGRRVLQPMLDVLLDVTAMSTYFREGDFNSGIAVGVVLLFGGIGMACVAAFTANKEYPHLSVVHSHNEMYRAFFAGIFHLGPPFLGYRCVRAWRDVTDHPTWRNPKAGSVTKREELDDFVRMVADMKTGMHFESLIEAGPQFVLQLTLIINGWDTVAGGEKGLGQRLSEYDLSAWTKVFSPMFSAIGLIMSQMDFLCENDRFVHSQWRRDKPLVMLPVIIDLTCQILLRVFPLCVLLDHHFPAGLAMVGAIMVYGIFMTEQSSREVKNKCECTCDQALISIFFAPHAWFFGMTFYAGHERDGARVGQTYEYNTVERSLLTFRGFTLLFVHLLFTLFAIFLTFIPSIPWGTNGDPRPQQGPRQNAMLNVSLFALIFLAMARSFLYYLNKRDEKWKKMVKSKAMSQKDFAQKRMFEADAFPPEPWVYNEVSPGPPVREAPAFKKYTSFHFGREPPPPPKLGDADISESFGDISIFERTVSRAAPAPPPMPTGLSNLDADDMVAKMRAEMAKAGLGGDRASTEEKEVAVEIRSETPTDEIISESDRRSMVGIPEEEGATSGGGSGALGNLSVGVPPSGRSTEADAASSRVSTLPEASVASSVGTRISPESKRSSCPASAASAASADKRGSTAPAPPSAGKEKPEPAWKKYARPRGGSVETPDEAASAGKAEPAWKKYARPRGGSVETPAGTSGGGRGSTAAKGGPSTEATENLTPQQAAQKAALNAWPAMPMWMRNLPLSMALEADDKDDAKTKKGKEDARAAADAAMKKAREAMDAKRK